VTATFTNAQNPWPALFSAAPASRLFPALCLAQDAAENPMLAEPSPDADLPLVRRTQAGELAAFDDLMRRHQALITGLLHRFCPWRADLEDLVQDTFLRAYRNLGQWRAEKPFVHWLKRIAVNVGLEYCRKNQRSPLMHRAPGGEDDDALARLPASADHEAKPGALAEAQWLLSHLAPDDRALLTLLYLDQMPLAEIAGHFGWSRTNAKVRAFRARAQLRKLLQHHGYTFA
jgi:RNA polymerase sigma-70 factor (ECF subfamily)